MLTDFDHVNIRTGHLEAMVTWYEEVLGLAPGWRPNFPFPGAWLYLGDQAIIHLVGVAPEPGAGAGELRIEHIAFRALDQVAFEARLNEIGVEFVARSVPGTEIVQIHIADPDGNHIHIDFMP